MEEIVDNILKLVTKVYDGLTEEDISELEKIALDRKDFFDKVSE